MLLETQTQLFQLDLIGKRIRLASNNDPKAYKSFARISRIKVGFPVLIVWREEEGFILDSTLTTIVSKVFP